MMVNYGSYNVTNDMDLKIQRKEAYATPDENGESLNGISEAQTPEMLTIRVVKTTENESQGESAFFTIPKDRNETFLQMLSFEQIKSMIEELAEQIRANDAKETSTTPFR